MRFGVEVRSARCCITAFRCWPKRLQRQERHYASFVMRLYCGAVHELRRSDIATRMGEGHCPTIRGALRSAIAAVLAHPFGIGNAHNRLGTNELVQVNAVPFQLLPAGSVRA